MRPGHMAPAALGEGTIGGGADVVAVLWSLWADVFMINDCGRAKRWRCGRGAEPGSPPARAQGWRLSRAGCMRAPWAA